MSARRAARGGVTPAALEESGGIPPELYDYDHPAWRTAATAEAVLDRIDPDRAHRYGPNGDEPWQRHSAAVVTFANVRGLTSGNGRYAPLPNTVALGRLGIEAMTVRERARRGLEL